MRATLQEPLSPIITPRGVEREYRIPKSTQHYWRHHADFPKPFKLGVRKVGYLRKDIEAWLAQRQRAAA
jgi:predicted DNA-binding transcriptional regulator AlpA